MTDDDPTTDTGHAEHLRRASDSTLTALTELVSASRNGVKAVSLWFEQHPLLGLIISAPISAIISKAVFDVFYWLNTIFFRPTVTVTNDIRLGTLPFPVGVTIYLLFTLWVFTVLVGYLRVANLRQRVEDLEAGQS